MPFFGPHPDPPPPPPRRPPPEWLGPPPSVVPGVVAERVVMYRDSRVAAVLSDFDAYPSGLAMTLQVTGRGPFFDTVIPVGRPTSGPLLRFGVALADGRHATFDGVRRGPPLPDETPDLVLLARGGSGGLNRPWRMGFWLWPLPPPGDVTFAVEWAAGGIPETIIAVDSAPFRAAATDAFEL